jgi:hypothetical protein
MHMATAKPQIRISMEFATNEPEDDGPSITMTQA